MFEKFIIDEKTVKYLKNTDDKIKLLIESIDEIDKEYIPDPFIALVNSIIYQQITFKAANSIWKRFVERVKEITPKNVIEVPFDDLRNCGLSRSKANYVKNIALAVINNDLHVDKLSEMTDDEIKTELIKIKGIGNWTADMFLIFSLNRPDVISYYDLAIRKGIQWLYSMKEEPSLVEFNSFKERYSPYNTAVSLYLWEITIRDYFKFESIDKLKSS